MKATKLHFLYVFIGLISLSSCQDDDDALPMFDQDFVRFSFFVNNNNEPFVFPQQAQNVLERSSFNFQKRDTLRIPVVLTSRDLSAPVSVSFESSLMNIASEDVSILPENQALQFSSARPSDTIYIVPKRRFSEANDARIMLELTESSNESILLGYPRENNRLDRFEIILLPTAPVVYTLEEKSISFEGVEGETHQLRVLFDQLVSPEEVEGISFLEGEFAQFVCDDGLQITYDFELNKQDFVGDSRSLVYVFEVLQDVQNFSSSLNIRLQNVANDNFVRTGNSLVNISKTVNTIEREGDIAKDWYNVSTNFHLTYGRAWYFNENNNQCRWQTFQAFTRPVEVPAGSEFDNGQGFHKYKIGFRNIIANPQGNIIGTNPFNFRRFYDGASTLSPAYNLTEAIEFFPNPEDNGATGVVSVISQTLVFLVGDDQIQVPICGSGTYQFNQTLNVWEMFVTIIADETEINGNSFVEKHLFIYSSNVAGNPENLDVDCSPYINF